MSQLFAKVTSQDLGFIQYLEFRKQEGNSLETKRQICVFLYRQGLAKGLILCLSCSLAKQRVQSRTQDSRGRRKHQQVSLQKHSCPSGTTLTLLRDQLLRRMDCKQGTGEIGGKDPWLLDYKCTFVETQFLMFCMCVITKQCHFCKFLFIALNIFPP